jgi:N-dimethylarginine dimethylaminohydrolase
MLRLLIRPTTYTILPIQKGQNPYIVSHYKPNHKAIDQHRHLVSSLKRKLVFEVDAPKDMLSDIVFVANGGLSLPRLPKPLIVLPQMRYWHRQLELSYLRAVFDSIGVKTVDFPGDQPFEGQAELKWFHGGTKAVCGYGHRSTRQAFTDLERLLSQIYRRHGLEPPELLVLPLESANYYHLDVAMLEFDQTKCIIHKRAFSPASIRKLQQFLGSGNVFIIDTADNFCLNAVIDGDSLITHTLRRPLRDQLERITGRKVRMTDTSEFEKSGGSVRCMVLDIYGL